MERDEREGIMERIFLNAATGLVTTTCPSCGLEERTTIVFAEHDVMYNIHGTVYKAHRCGETQNTLHFMINEKPLGCGLIYLMRVEWHAKVVARFIDGESPQRKVDNESV